MGDELTFGGRFELPATIAEGTDKRNDTLYRYGCSLQAKGVDDSEIEREIRAANIERCVPPMGEAEVSKLIAHVVRDYPKGHSAEFTRWLAETPGTAAAKAKGGGGMLWNDLDLSRLFAERNRHRLRFVVEAHSWYVYDGTKWAKDGAKPMGFVGEMLDELTAYVDTLPDGVDTTKAAKRMLAQSKSANRGKGLLEYAKPALEGHSYEFDRDLHLLNFENVTFDLARMQPKAHDPADLITKSTGYDYDPHAQSAEFFEILEAALTGADGVDTELMVFIQRAVGAALIGDTSWERFYLWAGVPRSGKSTLLEAMYAAFGDYAVGISYTTLADTKRNAGGATPDLAKLEGVRLVTCNEPEKGMLLNVALAKQLTGGDTITARNLHEGERSFRPHFTLFVNSNHLPDVNDQTLFEGDRVVLVPFNNRIEQDDRDRELKGRLLQPESLGGIMNWLIAGCGMRNEMGFNLPRVCTAELAKYRESSDKVGEFIADRCELSTAATAQGKELYQAWREWCEENGRMPGTAQNLYSDLKRRPGIKHHDRVRIDGVQARHVFEGIGLRRASMS